MKARIGDWWVEADVTRDLASNPHRVDASVYLSSDTGSTVLVQAYLSAADAGRYGALLSALVNPADDLGTALDRAADADECSLCGMPCDPGEADCPRCQDGAA